MLKRKLQFSNWQVYSWTTDLKQQNYIARNTFLWWSQDNLSYLLPLARKSNAQLIISSSNRFLEIVQIITFLEEVLWSVCTKVNTVHLLVLLLTHFSFSFRFLIWVRKKQFQVILTYLEAGKRENKKTVWVKQSCTSHTQATNTVDKTKFIQATLIKRWLLNQFRLRKHFLKFHVLIRLWKSNLQKKTVEKKTLLLIF